MNLKYRLLAVTFIGVIISVLLVVLGVSAAKYEKLLPSLGVSFDSNNPRVWAIINYQSKKVDNQYKPDDSVSQKRINSLKPALKSIVILSYSTKNRLIVNQLQLVATEQAKSDDAVNQAIDTAKEKSSLAKFFTGPNYKELKKVKTGITSNESRISAVKDILANSQERNERMQLNQQYTLLQKANATLKDQLKDSEKGFSLFGWFIRLSNKY